VGTLIAGDLNSYAREAPLQQLEDAGYQSLVHEFHPCGDSGCRQYSYRYKGERGSLDYLLASPGLRQRATSARAWNVNADEPRALTRMPARAATGPWRASDHNPVFTDLDLAD
jgi:predicted extracellular nuclease